MKPKITLELMQLTTNSLWYSIRGLAMILIGGMFATLSLVAPDVYMLGENASWVPVISLIVLLVGGLRCIDAFVSDSPQGFLFNMQGGILDLVVGFLVFFSTNDETNYINLLIVGYMLTQGLYRNILISKARFHNPISNQVTGLISIVLGLMIWFDWPTSMWFIAFSLSVDISFRGWALMVLASSLKMEPPS